MFPNYPVLICRRCTNSFEVISELRAETQVLGRIECPVCKYETIGAGVQYFLRFYPRLVQSEKAMSAEGISLVGAGAKDIMDLGHFSWLKETMSFQCKNCTHNWKIKFDPDILHFKKNPKMFFCPSCLKNPSPSITKEFFMCLNQTFENSFKFAHAQWDIFSPFGMSLPLKKIQSKIFETKYPI